jgi:ribonuclease BN (tRNA processing enzyme)
MRLTIIGSGDAFGSGGRFNTCFHIVTAGRTVLIDCGASTTVALRARGIDLGTIDAIILSHLHGDHFGGIPFMLLDAQYMTRRDRPLLIAGPPGSKARIEAATEVLYAGSMQTPWRFPWSVVEIPVGVPTDVLGLNVTTAEVLHSSGAPSTALRIADGEKTLAYSGDTQWTDVLFPVAAGADLFICECYEYERELTGHMTWKILRQKIPEFTARRMMITHMSPTVLSCLDELRQSGVLVAEDGLTLDV